MRVDIAVSACIVACKSCCSTDLKLLKRHPPATLTMHLLHAGTDMYLYMERTGGTHPDNSGGQYIAGTLDLATMRWIHVYAEDSLYCSGHTVSPDGRVCMAGASCITNAWMSACNHKQTTTTSYSMHVAAGSPHDAHGQCPTFNMPEHIGSCRMFIQTCMPL